MEVSTHTRRPLFRIILPGLLVALAGLAIILLAKRSSSRLEVDEKSQYSHIRIRRRGSFREMLFVRDNGQEVRQSGYNIDRPQQLTSRYAQVMFASYLFRPRQQRVLIVGLGGGSMVRFLEHHEPKLLIDVVEIDPVVVRLADEYFNVRSNQHVQIKTTDGFQYLRETEHRYDVIYFDAFLKPSADTDATGVPQKLKTIAFFRDVQTKLLPDGVIAFNLNYHAQMEDDIATIAEAFPHSAVFDYTGSRSVVAFGLQSPFPPESESIQDRAAELDQRFQATFSFRKMLDDRRR